MAESQPTPSSGLPLSCLCGHITLTTPSRTPLDMSHCHCTSCRKQSGSAFGTSIFFPTAAVFPLPADLEAKLAVFEHPTDSGGTMRCFFCPRCGVRMFNAALLPDGTMRGVVAFKAGVVDGGWEWKGEVRAKHIFTRSAVMELAEGWECFEGGSLPRGLEGERKG